MNEEFAVILFHTSSHAIRADQLLRKKGIACKLIPVPRHLSSDCGVCARIRRRDVVEATETLRNARVETVSIHET